MRVIQYHWGNEFKYTTPNRIVYYSDYYREFMSLEHIADSETIRGHQLPAKIVTFDGLELDYGHLGL